MMYQFRNYKGTTMATHFEKITLFEKNFQSALNLGPDQRTSKNFFEVR